MYQRYNYIFAHQPFNLGYYFYGGKMNRTQQLTKAILEFLNDYQEEHGDHPSGEIVGALEWAKLAHFRFAIEEKNERGKQK